MERKDLLNGSHGTEERQLPDIPGINVDKGIKRVVGNQKLYVELLRNFNRDFSGTAVEIRSTIGKGDLQTAQRLAHTLKGVAGNLSVEVLQDRATELDGALKKKITGETVENLDALVANVAGELTCIRKAIDEIPAAADEGRSSEEGEAGSSGKLREYLNKLEPGLSKRNPKHSKSVLEEMSVFSWPEEYRQKLQDLAAFIRKYRFKEALAVLNELLGRMNG